MYFRVYILLLSIFISFLGYSQKEVVKDSILWDKDYVLEWSDFKGAVPFGDLGIKKAVSRIGLFASVEGFDDNDTPIFKIEVFFHKEDSWTILKTDDLLKHERGHFDIAEIYARKLRRIYKEMYIQKVSSIDSYSNAFDKINKELDLIQKQYDKEVYFIPENRKLWYEKITKELKELQEHAL